MALSQLCSDLADLAKSKYKADISKLLSELPHGTAPPAGKAVEIGFKVLESGWLVAVGAFS